MHLSAVSIRKKYDISPHTLRSWANQGKLDHIRLGGNGTGKRLYNMRALEEYLNVRAEGKKIIYARVSSSKQRGDLKRQIESLQENYPTHKVISDVGSGLNYKRKGLQKILKCVFEGVQLVTKNLIFPYTF